MFFSGSFAVASFRSLTNHQTLLSCPSSPPKPQFASWLIEQVETGQYLGLCYVGQNKFRVPWKHNSRKDCNDEDSKIFRVGPTSSPCYIFVIPGDLCQSPEEGWGGWVVGSSDSSSTTEAAEVDDRKTQ